MNQVEVKEKWPAKDYSSGAEWVIRFITSHYFALALAVC
jgi:hypothetical protein